jgi:type I restriction enzyme S subunit
MSEWKEYKFSDFANINPPVKLKQNERYSFVEMKDLSDGQRHCYPNTERELSGGARFQEGDTLFARITPCLENGKICQAKDLKNGVGFGSTEFFVFRGKEGVSDNDFVFYLSRWDEVRAFAEINFDGTSGRQRVPKDAFNNLFLNFPPLPEQKSIASVLSSLDDKIDLLHRQNKTLEALAETLFRQRFVRRPEIIEGEEAEEGWETKGLEDLIIFDPREKVSSSIEYTFFDMKCLSDSSMTISEGIKRTVNSGSAFRNGDTLLAKITPCLENGKTGFVMNLDGDELARGSTEFIVMRAKEGVSPYFVYCLARYSDFRNTAILSMTGTSGRQRVQAAVLKDYEIKYSKAIMDRFHSACHLHFKKIKQNQIQIHTLTRLRDTLLPKLMSGEVRVKEKDNKTE